MLICLIALAFAGLLAAPAPPRADDAGHPPPDAAAPGESTSEAAASASDVLEIIYQGRTYRVPLEAGGSQDVQLGPSTLRLQFGSGPSVPASSGQQPVGGGLQTPVIAPPPEAGFFRLTRESIILAVALGTVVLGLLAYILILAPLWRRRPLKEALSIIANERRGEYDRAEDLLVRSLLAGLRKKDIATARYALALLRTLLGRAEEAATVLADLEKSAARIDAPTAYLLLYTNSRLRHHERVERIYGAHERVLKGYRQADLIVSISFLELAHLRLARREINGAMHYFNEVRRLQVLAGEVPAHIDEHEVMVGVSSLFEKNTDDAIKHFQAAIAEAHARQTSDVGGRIGLALCEWRNGKLPEVDHVLEEILKELARNAAQANGGNIAAACPHCGKGYRVRSDYLGKTVLCKGCRRRFEIIDKDGEKSKAAADDEHEQLLNDDDLLLRNVGLWHCVSRLLLWQSRDANSGLPDSERQLLRKRAGLVIRVDPDIGDPHLILGLIDYYFARDDAERASGREQIERAIANDVHLPEVLQLMEREHKLASLSEHSLTYFHQLSRKYIENAEVDPQWRERFARKMNRYTRFREFGAVEAAENAAVPSLENLRGRGQILSTRVANILRFRMQQTDPELREKISEQLTQMNDRTRALSESAEMLQKTEYELMEHTGEFLFQDDDPADGESPLNSHAPAP